jgi:hypothetical protein
MISQSRMTAKGIWIWRIRLAAVADISRKPQNSNAPWIVTASDEISMIEGQDVFSFPRCVKASVAAMPPYTISIMKRGGKCATAGLAIVNPVPKKSGGKRARKIWRRVMAVDHG